MYQDGSNDANVYLPWAVSSNKHWITRFRGVGLVRLLIGFDWISHVILRGEIDVYPALGGLCASSTYSIFLLGLALADKPIVVVFLRKSEFKVLYIFCMFWLFLNILHFSKTFVFVIGQVCLLRVLLFWLIFSLSKSRNKHSVIEYFVSYLEFVHVNVLHKIYENICPRIRKYFLTKINVQCLVLFWAIEDSFVNWIAYVKILM